MKKIFFLLLLIPFFASAQKTTPGNYTYIAQKYEWDAGIYKGLGLPSGSGPAAFITGQVQRAGAVYFDTLGVDAGFYIYNGTAWVLQGTPSAVDLDDELLSGGSVTPQGTGFKLSIQEAIYRISGVIYGSDSGTVTLSGSDPSLNRIDYIYLGTDGAFHVLEGIPGLPAAEPRLENDQLGIAFVSIPAGSTTPGVSTVVVYNENTESTVSNTGTTTDPDNTTNVFTGAKSLNVTNIAANDMIHFTAPITFNASGFDALAIHMLPKAVLGSGNRLYVQLFVGSTAVSNEVEIVWNRNNITTYQAISISAQALGTLTNYNVTRVRLRYVGSGANFAGFYFDYIFFQTGTSQPNPPGGGGFPNIIPPATWGVIGNGTQNITITAPGLRPQVMRGNATAETDSSVKYIGTINSLTKSANGATINTLTNEIIFQEADIDDNGVLSEYDWRRFDTTAKLTVVNLDNTVDTLLTYVDPFTTGVMGIKDSTGIGIHNNGRYLAFYNTGSAGGGPDTSHVTYINGNYTVQATDRYIQSEGGSPPTITMPSAAANLGRIIHITANSQGLFISPVYKYDIAGTTSSFLGSWGTGVFISDGTDWIKYINSWTTIFDDATGTGESLYTSTSQGSDASLLTKNFRRVKGSASVSISVVGNDLVFTSSGGGGSGLFPTTGTGTATGAVTGSLAGNVLTVVQGSNTLLTIDPTAGNEISQLLAANTTGADNFAYFQAATTNTQGQFSMSSSFNGTATEAFITGTSDASSSILAYSATTHTFTGPVTFADLAGNGVGIASIDNAGTITWGASPNLIVDSIGVNGIELVIPRNDSVLHRLFTDGVFTKADTLATGEAVSNLDTANSLLKLYIQANSTGSAGVLWSRLSSDHTLSDVNTDQVLFPSSQDIFPVQANTLYLVEGVYEFTTGTASHSKGIGFTLAGGATVASSGIESQSWGTVPGTSSTASTNIFLTGLTTVTATALTTAGGATMTFKGLIQVTDAGTFQPIVRFTSAPGGTNLLKANSWLKMTPIGADTFTTAGGVN